MTSIREFIRQRFTPVQPLPPGTFHFQAPPDAPLPYRLHLRIEEGGRGVLIVNASTVLHLNPSATEYAYHLVGGTPADQVAQEIAARYRISRAQARLDFDGFIERIQTLIEVPDLDPVAYLDFDRHAPYSQSISAPYRLDCAITYRLPEGVNPGLAPTKRVERELTTDEWRTVLDKAWEAGIPHVIFTGGEPTLREDLPALIAHAEANGQVSGLLTDGLKLAEPEYLDTILKTGLDHIVLNLQPDNLQVAAALKNTLSADIHLTVHLTLRPDNAARMSWTVEKLAQMGIGSLSLSADDPALGSTLDALRNHAATLGFSLVWDLPVPYGAFNPVTLETAEDQSPEGAGRAWLYVEPDGDVLPAQGMAGQILGNFLLDPWKAIWKAKK